MPRVPNMSYHNESSGVGGLGTGWPATKPIQIAIGAAMNYNG